MTYRKPVNKRKSAKRFKAQISHTKEINIAPNPMRGGYRL